MRMLKNHVTHGHTPHKECIYYKRLQSKDISSPGHTGTATKTQVEKKKHKTKKPTPGLMATTSNPFSSPALRIVSSALTLPIPSEVVRNKRIALGLSVDVFGNVRL